MTEQPDTAEYRDFADMLGRSAPKAIRDLCDALDDARAEPALDIAYVDVLLAKISELTVRARAAEARIADLETEVSMRYRSVVHSCCEEKATAEARIAAALGQGHCVTCVHQALTGDVV